MFDTLHADCCLLFCLTKSVGCADEAFVDTDNLYLQHDASANRDDGCTAVTAVLIKQRLVVANVGDSRAVLSRKGQGRT